MKKYVLIMAVVALAGIVLADTFTEVGNSRYWGQTQIPKLTRAIDANFDMVSAFFADGILSQGGLDIDANTNKFKTTTTVYYTINGIQYSKNAETNVSFTANDTINVAESTNSAFYGSWLIELNAAGTIATKPAGGLTNQVYTTAGASLEALPAPTAANVAIGTVTIKADAGAAFTANTTGMNTNSTTFVDAAIKVRP